MVKGERGMRVGKMGIGLCMAELEQRVYPAFAGNNTDLQI